MDASEAGLTGVADSIVSPRAGRLEQLPLEQLPLVVEYRVHRIPARGSLGIQRTANGLPLHRIAARGSPPLNLAETQSR